MRYTINYRLESPKQASPPDDSAGLDWVIKPSQTDFVFTTKYAGSFVEPDKFDYELSTPDQPSQPTVRGIRIGQGQWYFLSGSWVPSTADSSTAFPFTPLNLCDAIVSPLDLTGKTGVAEKVGDTDAQHLHIAAAPLPLSAQLFGERSDNGKLLKSWDVDLWLSNKGARLVKAEAVAKTTYPYGRELSSTLSLEVGSFDDDGIADINPPL